MVRKKVKDLKKRRSAREYEILALTKIEKETRKIGNIEIYVDYDCRRNYELEDLVTFVTRNYGP